MGAVAEHEVLPICPEVASNLPIPRPACEITSTNPLQVLNRENKDVTEAFVSGAERTLTAMQDFGCEAAILKTKSPSCGTGLIYDGTFSGTLCEGWGVAATLIRNAGIPCVDESQAAQLLNHP